ncbi:MAG: hypothetical protein L3K10_03655 [Thermoplasmata archaeon]|nr:hypothetical protein [Thermoplasmata archaeon]
MRWPRNGFWGVAAGCIAALAIVVVVLFVVPSAAPPPTMTVEGVDWQIVQPPPTNGTNEFAALWINQTGPVWGFPIHIRPGGAFNDSLIINSNSPEDLPICRATITPPFFIVSTTPTLPMLTTHYEDNLLTLTISVHVGAGATVLGSGTIYATSATLAGCNT